MNQKILIIDDSQDIRELMAMLFEPEGYEVTGASDGIQALVKLDTEDLPGLIFLDHQMAGMDGPEFLKELERVHPEILARVPIIMLTALEARSVAKNRATEVISKREGIERLLSLARQYLH